MQQHWKYPLIQVIWTIFRTVSCLVLAMRAVDVFFVLCEVHGFANQEEYPFDVVCQCFLKLIVYCVVKPGLNHNFLSIKQKWMYYIGRLFVYKLHINCRMSLIRQRTMVCLGVTCYVLPLGLQRTAHHQDGWVMSERHWWALPVIFPQMWVSLHIGMGNVYNAKKNINILCFGKCSLSSLLSTLHCAVYVLL